MPAAIRDVPAPPRRAHATDEQLARAAGRGDVAAFEALYERYHAPLLSFSRHMLGRAHDAEDVVQHTFLAADREFRSGETPKAVRAWLYTVARNRCVSVLRARREEHGLPDAGVPSIESLAADVERREDLRNLLADLRRLPERQRAALLLAELGDLSHPEVAQVIGVRPGKVKALVFQAREALMAAAHARSIPCRSIQEELATATGAGLRRRHLRNHLAQCSGCREYADRVRAQRASLALILPVIPSVALRESVFSGLAGGTTAAGAGAGVGIVAVKATTAKLLTIAAVGGAAAGGGTVAVTADDAHERTRPGARARSAPARAEVPAVAPSVRPAPVAAREEEQSSTRAASPPRHDRGAASRPRDVSRRRDRHGAPKGRRPSPQPVRAGHPTTSDKTPPGQAKKEQRGAPPGKAKREQPPPGQAKKAPVVTPENGKPKPAKPGGPKPRTDKPPKPTAAQHAASATPVVPAAPAPPGHAVKESKAVPHKAAADGDG